MCSPQKLFGWTIVQLKSPIYYLLSYMTDSGENEQGGAITITAVAGGQDGQEIVLPADLVVAHQLIAVQQSNVDV